MRHLIVGLAIGLGVVATSSRVEASIWANSYLDIDNFVIINDATGSPVTADFFPSAAGDIQITGGTNISSGHADVGGIPSSNTANPIGLDAPVAYESTTGGGVGPNAVFTVLPSAGAAPVGLGLGAFNHYAVADTATDGGTIVTLVPGPPTGGAEVESFGEVSFDQGTVPAVILGDAAGTVLSSTSFFTVTAPITLHLDFDALVSIILNQALSPPPAGGVVLKGSTSFGATLSGTGTITVGGVSTPIFTFAPAALNTGNLTNSTPSSVGGYSLPLTSFVSPSVTLGAGSYGFTLTQGSAVAINNVPEATSVLTWALLMLSSSGIAYVAACRRRAVAKL